MFSTLNNPPSSTLNTDVFTLLNMTTLKERLNEALSEAGLLPTALAKRAEVSRATVSLWLSGTTKSIQGENLTRAAKALDVSPHWLATGEGQKKSFQQHTAKAEASAEQPEIPLSNSEKRLIEAFSKLSEEDREWIIEIAEAKVRINNAPAWQEPGARITPKNLRHQKRKSAA